MLIGKFLRGKNGMKPKKNKIHSRMKLISTVYRTFVGQLLFLSFRFSPLRTQIHLQHKIRYPIAPPKAREWENTLSQVRTTILAHIATQYEEECLSMCVAVLVCRSEYYEWTEWNRWDGQSPSERHTQRTETRKNDRRHARCTREWCTTQQKQNKASLKRRRTPKWTKYYK